MRTDAADFAALNRATSKEPRYVVAIEFPTVTLYISSHDDISGIPATLIPSCLIEPSLSSQKLNPDEGRAEIGAAGFSVADVDELFSSTVRGLYAAGYGIRNRLAKFYVGYRGLAFSGFALTGTQIIKGAKYQKGAFAIECNDVQRSAKKEIFVTVETTIGATVEAADTTINVASTTGFSRVYHGASYTDAASSTVGYLKIKDEIIRYTGTTATSFTGCTRGALGTTAARYVADGATPASRREKVSEYIYLELPAPKLAYALLTGTLYNDSASLPASWHLGIPSTLVRLADFTGIGVDLWNTANDAAGVVLRFEGLTKTDGKAFLETEIARLLGLFMPVYADGTLGLRRMTRVLQDAASVLTLDETNSVSLSELNFDMDSLHNAFSIDWNWNGKSYTRRTTFLDAASVNKHGQAPTLSLKYRGLYGGRHTDGLVLKLLDSLRDRYSAPPVRLTVETLHSLNGLEVGDVVRVKFAQLRDYTGASSSIDRSFEVQSTRVNHKTGAVSLELFGSTATASVDSPTTASSALPDAFYTATGTNLASVMTITGGVVSGGPYTLNGGTDLTATGSVWYYNGDLTIGAGVVVNITGNVQLRIKGYLTVNGTISGVGGGLAGVADNAALTPIVDGNPGYVGNTRGRDGAAEVYLGDTNFHYRTKAPATTIAKNASFPYLALEVSGSNLLGLPTDLRGTGGAPGGKVVRNAGLGTSAAFLKSGGTGGNGGAGLCTISRGFGLGAAASINLSGANTTTPSAYHYGSSPQFDVYPGAGAPGGPGAFLLLLDGGLLSVPDLAGRFQSKAGVADVPAAKTVATDTATVTASRKAGPFAGWVSNPDTISGLDLSYSASRIQYIPAPETATADVSTIPPVESLSVAQGSSGFTVSFAPGAGTPAGTIFEVWLYSSATPFSSASKVAEGSSTTFFVPRSTTALCYIWIRARYQLSTGALIYSTTTPVSSGQPAQAASIAGTFAQVSPTSVSASAASSSITTASVTASLVGGTGSTYSWARQSGSTSISANSASAATTTFSATGVGVGATVSAVFRVTINGTYTADVSVDCTNTSAALSASASPTSLTKTGTAASLTTASTTVSAAGGVPGYTYSWAKVSGGTITADSSTAATTTFSATGLAAPETRTATFRCTVTDTASATTTVDVSITITRSAVSVTASPSYLYKAVSFATATTASTTATASGGTSPYSYAWTKVSGGTITCNSPSAATTTFTGSSMGYDETRTATFRVTATDADSATATFDVSIELYREPAGGGGGCPTCCFAPGTLIEVADMATKRIEDVEIGDVLVTERGPVAVSEIIVRTDREMYRLEFEDGTTVDVSDDHPLYVEGRGWSSLNPSAPYKDIGVPDMLRIGDPVRKLGGSSTRLLRVESIECPEKVYTFAESGFFANGLLVY